MNTFFFYFHEKRKQVHGKYQCTYYFLYHQYRSTKCTSKSQFQNDVRQIPQCKSNIEINVLFSALGNHRIARIVELPQIHVASFESLWLSMLHNRVCPFSSDNYLSFLFHCWELFDHIHLLEWLPMQVCQSRPQGIRPRNWQCSLFLIMYNDVGQSHNASLLLKQIDF